MAVTAELGPVVGTQASCRALGVSRASLYRRRRPRPAPSARPRPSRALTGGERGTVLDQLHSPRFVDQAPAEVYATLLDEGVYHCSIRTMYRLLADAQEVRERRNQLRHTAPVPQLLATRPNEVNFRNWRSSNLWCEPILPLSLAPKKLAKVWAMRSQSSFRAK